MNNILLNASTLKAELMAVVSMIEDGDLTGALRQLRALYVSTELQESLQTDALARVQRALDSTRHLAAVPEEKP